jgi:DNA-binding CsgD family transcriptional regulator
VFVAPAGLAAHRFVVERDEYALLEFPWPAVTLPDGLSPAERDVARRVAEGQSLPEIAKSRETSVHTVGNQLRSIYAKLGIGNRNELVRLCRQRTRQGPQ